MKKYNILPLCLASMALVQSSLVFGGTFANEQKSESVFDKAIRPITSPTLFDLAVPRTQVNAIYINQVMPDNIELAGGGTAPLGGDFNVYAVQFEYALNERTSIIATKDGYIDFNPDNTASSQSGFANLGAGIKRALIYDTKDQFILSGIVGAELPTGNSDVWQGEGMGAADLRLTALKLYDRLQLAGSASVHVPFDGAESLTGMFNLHASYEISPWFIPVIEMSWFRVINDGDGSFGFNDQGGSLVPQNAAFEAGDLVNWGTANGEDNPDIVNLALGFRSRLSDNSTFGVAYEFPLTDDEATLLSERVTASLTYTF